MQDDDRAYLVALSFFEGIGPMRYRALKEYFGSPRAIFHAEETDLANTGLGKKLIANFIAFRKTFNPEKFVNSFEQKGIFVVSDDDAYYPKLLREIPSAPFILYGLGDRKLLNKSLAVGIVGTRKPTPYGREVTTRIAYELAEEGFTIVSGMAMGVDAIAHQTALSRNGATIAVLGCGVDICYPEINRSIYNELKKHGLILSEFPPGMRTSIGTFPSRNRIVAGLSLGVVITEGAKDSGALITARYASEFGRDVFAVPGPITSPLSDATMKLLKDGAKPVSCAQDIIEEYQTTHRAQKKKDTARKLTGLTAFEKSIIDQIALYGNQQIDDIARNINATSPEVSIAISNLTLKGILTEMAAGEYTIATF